MREGNGLSPRQCGMVRDVLAPLAPRLARAALFGSRATGRWRPNSDIDLVLFGDVTDADVDRPWTLFDESALDVSVDVVRYGSHLHPPLREHIDRCAVTLFDRDTLLVDCPPP